VAREIQPSDLANIRAALELVNLRMPNIVHGGELYDTIAEAMGSTREAANLAICLINSWDKVKVALQAIGVGVDGILDQIKLAWSLASSAFQDIWEWIKDWVYHIHISAQVIIGNWKFSIGRERRRR